MIPICFDHSMVSIKVRPKEFRSICLNGHMRGLILVDKLFIVLVDQKGGENKNRNIYCYNFDGEIAWQIGEPHVFPFGKNSPYVGIGFDRDSEYIWATNSNSYGYLLNPKTGEIIESKFTK